MIIFKESEEEAYWDDSYEENCNSNKKAQKKKSADTMPTGIAHICLLLSILTFKRHPIPISVAIFLPDLALIGCY